MVGHHAIAVRELRAGAVKARRPRAGTRVGGAKRRALHGAEHSSKLCGVMAGGPPLQPGRCREVRAEGEIRVPDDMTRAATHANDPRAAWTKTMNTTGAEDIDRWAAGA